jgi:hypothetical protein
MPKDATKNVDRYKIRGGQLNEFDFHQNQEELAKKPAGQATNLIPGMAPEARVEGLQPVVTKARKPAKKRATKATKSTKAAKARKATKVAKGTKERNTPRGATAKKLAARKAAKKKR